jgi:hypothetical protein
LYAICKRAHTLIEEPEKREEAWRLGGAVGVSWVCSGNTDISYTSELP